MLRLLASHTRIIERKSRAVTILFQPRCPQNNHPRQLKRSS